MSRAFWCLRFGVPFRNPGRILYAYYPELRRVDNERPTPSYEFYDILFLGVSTLHKDWGQVEQDLFEKLAYNGHRNVRIFNLAKPSQTSQDSWLKHAALGAARFELMVFYDGINEARANNAPSMTPPISRPSAPRRLSSICSRTCFQISRVTNWVAKRKANQAWKGNCITMACS